MCFDVDIVDDAVYEDLKGDFIVELLPLGMVVYSQQSALVSILDDDSKSFKDTLLVSRVRMAAHTYICTHVELAVTGRKRTLES